MCIRDRVEVGGGTGELKVGRQTAAAFVKSKLTKQQVGLYAIRQAVFLGPTYVHFLPFLIKKEMHIYKVGCTNRN